jgi:nitrogen-specific signal transduction histidine kinase
MTPKARLTFSITALAGAVAVALSVLALYWLTQARTREVYEVARVSAEAVKTYLLQRVPERAVLPPGAGIEEAKLAWQQAARDDLQLEQYLISAVAASSTLVEVLIASGTHEVLASSNPSRLDRTVPPGDDLETWTQLPPWESFRQLLSPARDLEHSIPLAAGGSSEPVFNIRVLVSTALVRDAVMPQIRNLALAGLLCLVGAAALAGLLANIAARPLVRVSELIDRISEGASEAELPPPPPDSELAAIQSKLALLGGQARGATQVDQMLERLQDATLLFDAAGNLVMASAAADRFLDSPRWDLIGQPLHAVFGDSTPLGALIQTSARLNRSIRDHHLDWPLPDGTFLPITVSLELLTTFPERKPLGAVVTLRDAASHRQIESQIDASYRHEAFGRLLQGVAHEIKNPLNSIYQHLQMLELELTNPEPETREELDTIKREIKTLDRMVVTLLDFTRPLELSLAETDLIDLATELASLVRPQAEGKGIEITVDAPPTPVTIRADRPLLRQALLNVVTNAVESMEQPGRVTLAVTESPAATTLSITDQGPGIPEEIREKIFNLYFTTKGKRGSGIGLAMTYRVTQLHNAELEVESDPGQGTTFHLRFPNSGTGY